jgi:two-component system invasion response regulator UvrY
MSIKHIHIALVDDHALVRMGFRMLLQQDPSLRVVLECASGESFFDSVRHTEIDILVLDLTMPGMGGLELIKRCRMKYEQLPMLVLSAHHDVVHIRRALHAGALGFLGKDSAPELLVQAVHAVAGGQVFLPAHLQKSLQLADISGDTQSPLERLSEREFEVFIRLAKGESVTTIAQELKVSQSTAGTHLYHVKQKLGAQNQAELTLLALKHHLINI